MARDVFPRSAANHERKAAEILRRHAQLSGQPIYLTIPIELVVEQTYGLSVEYASINEPEGTMILGALDPRRRTVVMNEAHIELFDDIIGPDRGRVIPRNVTGLNSGIGLVETAKRKSFASALVSQVFKNLAELRS